MHPLKAESGSHKKQDSFKDKLTMKNYKTLFTISEKGRQQRLKYQKLTEVSLSVCLFRSIYLE